MGLFQSFSNWRAAKYQQKVANAEENGFCPDCGGQGFSTFANEHFYTTYDCPSCNGSGLFSEWQGNN
ncbi:methionine aminopeptidase [Aquibacillus sp. 3ASR75-11]|uniref:Methionine aminopeptidase n=1 Tax=Terrihalobacillus insolitus TaxID=2950438 RepID=A0A9X3WR41_9BACI|nr:methionine aminopeptidase [Terrihalobacillus insolitus]MDC3412139.1 methionine aminopeptidase [Terrihalobacillus insolitus]MDC3423168.1 methionine aminopeptidase [Terrihalobacillus insolitus]